MPEPPKTREEIETWLQVKIAAHLGVEANDVDVNREFLTFDIDSIVAFSIAGDVVEWTGMEFSPTLVWEYPTISDLSLYLNRTMRQRSGLGN